VRRNPKGRPAKLSVEPELKRQITSFSLHPEMYNRLKALLRDCGLSQTEYIETLIRTDLAARER
jgi:predicted DNA-binding protein